MGLYLEKIEENEKKIKKLKATIETSKAKLKKLEVLAREREQSAKLKADGLTDSDRAVTVDGKDSDTDYSDDEFGHQMSFTDSKNPYED